MKYLGNRKVKDSFVYNEFMIKRDPFYHKEKSDIQLIATAVGII
ncbi:MULTISPECIES: hypothetical protein [Bacillus]|uniref:Uncharacterized protein n=1 Tax=Bacillus wiedmannii TaxID=1890302 RepID=A0A1C4DJ45_9BACI|nr:hypothetical protein [Bacillus wiedmannii]SCC31377.1 Uncharacterized protein BC05F1_02703 [Bacillus wiedmannii]